MTHDQLVTFKKFVTEQHRQALFVRAAIEAECGGNPIPEEYAEKFTEINEVLGVLDAANDLLVTIFDGRAILRTQGGTGETIELRVSE